MRCLFFHRWVALATFTTKYTTETAHRCRRCGAAKIVTQVSKDGPNPECMQGIRTLVPYFAPSSK